jgi:hypothetical protein
MRSLVPAVALLAGCRVVGIQVATPAASDGVGAAATAFALTSQAGDTVTLGDALAGGPTLLVFYRGFW